LLCHPLHRLLLLLQHRLLLAKLLLQLLLPLLGRLLPLLGLLSACPISGHLLLRRVAAMS
jgi:hypothetical protein